MATWGMRDPPPLTGPIMLLLGTLLSRPASKQGELLSNTYVNTYVNFFPT